MPSEEVAMVFNNEKFEALRYWPGKVLKPDTSYLDPAGKPIEEKIHLRDLGVQVGNDYTFSTHIEQTVASGSKLAGWALRSFRRRSKQLMLTIWKSMVLSWTIALYCGAALTSHPFPGTSPLR